MSQGAKTLTAVFSVVRDPELSTTQKALWILIRSYPPKGCFASAQTLAEQLSLSDTHVSRCRRELVTLGYLERELRGPRPPIFRAVLPERVCTDDDPRVGTHADSTPVESGVEVKGSAKESAKGSAKESAPMQSPLKDEYGSEYGLENGSENKPLLGDESPERSPVGRQKFPALSKLSRKGRAYQYPTEFEGAFSNLPARHVSHAKPNAYRAWRGQVGNGVDEPFQLEAAALAYADEQQALGKVGTQYVMQAATFFGPGERWRPYSGVSPDHLWTPKSVSGYRDAASDIDWAAEAEKAEALT